ncbi:MAG TPA: XdhC family protein [Acidimicrobiales bacterium]|nr:XdhC family protein [Acidimicrobiales bacterium]
MPSSPLQEAAAAVAAWLAEGRSVAVGRVVGISGFSTWPGDELLAVDDRGRVAGSVLAGPGTGQLVGVMADVLAAGEPERTVTVEIHGKAVIEAGLSCGGQADVLVQPAAALPAALWAALSGRRPVALVSAPGQPPVAVLDAAAASSPLEARGAEVLAAGHSAVVAADDGVLVEAWVPAPRLVVAGTGDLVAALAAQAALLGWDTRAVEAATQLADALAWAGGTAAVVVLSHDPHVDVPVLRAALDGGAPYVGAMGSRGTQSRRLDRLRADGVPEALLERIHRPVGLDLGGRSAPEVALAICAEVLAARTGRSGGPLSARSGPIHDRPAARTP